MKGQRWVNIAFLILSGIALLLLRRSIVGDGQIRFDHLVNVIFNGQFRNIDYSIIGPLFSLPLLAIDLLFYNEAGPFVTSYNTLLFILFLIFYAIYYRRDDQTRVLRFLIFMVFGSMFVGNIWNYYGETFSAVTVAAAIMLFATDRPKSDLAGLILFSLGVANTPALMVPAIFYLGYNFLVKRQIKYVAFAFTPALLILLENFIFRGGLFQFPYQGVHGFRTILTYSGLSGFSYPVFFGIISILFSSGKGLIFFTPGMFLPLQKTGLSAQKRNIYFGTLFFVVGSILIYAGWWAWYGGFCWGPRFFLFASFPASFVLSVITGKKMIHVSGFVKNALLLIVISLSFWVSLNGILSQWLDYSLYTGNNFQHEYLHWYVPENSVLWLPFVTGKFVFEKRDMLYVVLWGLSYIFVTKDLYLKMSREVFLFIRNFAYDFFGKKTG